jgi:hypothetical protein
MAPEPINVAAFWKWWLPIASLTRSTVHERMLFNQLAEVFGTASSNESSGHRIDTKLRHLYIYAAFLYKLRPWRLIPCTPFSP